MKKVLLSWIATNNDFKIRNKKGEMILAEGGINENGPHFNLYKHFLDFDEHYLLCQKGPNDKNVPVEWEFLARKLGQTFNKRVHFVYMNISDISSVGGIKSKVSDFMAKTFTNEKIEAFVNPGPPAAQTAWYLLGMESKISKEISLFKIREARFTTDKINPEKLAIIPNASKFANASNMLEIEEVYRRTKKYKEPFVSESLEFVYQRAFSIAGNNATTVSIYGATGTGKELLAKYIHKKSARKNNPFKAINCGSFNDQLLESRLFGYEKGAFTGAYKTTKGIFEEADKGTIFLDEIGDISPKMQVTLLRVLQEKEITRIGSVKNIPLDFRVIVASHKNLWQLCNEGKFRFDLFYRLAIAELEIPAFSEFSKKERKTWIEFFLERKNVEHDKPQLKLDKKVWDLLIAHPFPGNIRELENIIDTFYAFCNHSVSLNDVPKRFTSLSDTPHSLMLDDVIKIHIKKVLVSCDGNKSEAARILGISTPTLRERLK